MNYLKHFTGDDQSLRLDYLFAATDSKASHRARLSIEPIWKKFGLAIDGRLADEQFQMLADKIRAKPHGTSILICWLPGEILQLIRALGAAFRQFSCCQTKNGRRRCTFD